MNEYEIYTPSDEEVEYKTKELQYGELLIKLN